MQGNGERKLKVKDEILDLRINAEEERRRYNRQLIIPGGRLGGGMYNFLVVISVT